MINPIKNFNFGLGAEKSKEDYRDIKLGDVALAIPLLQKFQIDYSNITIFNQKKLGICVAAATATRKEKMESDGKKLSVRDLYSTIKNKIDMNSWEGTSIRNGLKALFHYGVSTEKTSPTDVTLNHQDFINFTPSIEAELEALVYKDKSYVNVPIDSDSLRLGIFQSNSTGIIARMEVGKEWWTPSWAKEDILPLRPPKQVISGHAVVLTGWDFINGRLAFYGRNSWGTEWADSGNFYFFYDEYKPTEAWVSIDVSKEMVEEKRNLPAPSEFRHAFGVDMKYGETSDEVKYLQIKLSILGYFKVTPTGYYGSLTAKAVKQFQLDKVPLSWYERYIWKDLGNKIGHKTLKALNEYYAI